MKNLYSKSLMAAVAVMMLASCSNEEPAIGGANGEQTSVTLGLTVAGTKAAGDMNFNDKTVIKNIAVVPFANNVSQKPIRWDNLDTDDNKAQTAQMVNTVDKFYVYGNLTSEQYAKTNNSYTLGDADFALQTAGMINGTQTYEPHKALYYFANAEEFWRGTEGTDWNHVTNWAKSSGVIGDAKFIKITDVNYAVGTFAVAVLNGDETECFYDNAEMSGPAKTATAAKVKVSGIMIEGQNSFNKELQVTGGDVTVYEEAEGAGGEESNFSAAKITNESDALTNGKIFVIVSPTAKSKEINANIEFTLPANTYLKRTDGTKIGGTTETQFYLGVRLKTAKAASEGTGSTYNIDQVFAADYLTILNATVKNWGISSETPVVVTDAEIGVEFDVNWKAGNIYDIEI